LVQLFEITISITTQPGDQQPDSLPHFLAQVLPAVPRMDSFDIL